MRRPSVLVASLVLAASMLASVGPGAAEGVSTVDHKTPFLAGVSAVSPTDAWAVGSVNLGQADSRLVLTRTLAEHWDGSSWQRVPSPNPGGRRHSSGLQAVSASSSTSVWAVGSYLRGPFQRTLILSWNGARWTQVASANPSDNCDLTSVTAVSPTQAWAAGDCYVGPKIRPLIEHWDGSSWTRVASPSKARHTWLWGLNADSTSDAWAVGRAGSTPYVEHWDGTRWAPVAAPDRPRSELYAVRALSPTNVWAVGAYDSGHTQKAFVEHWDGSTWKQARLPGIDDDRASSNLTSVTATSPTDIWATGRSGLRTLIAHWDGTRWTKLASPNPGRSQNVLNGVSADSVNDGWTVGLAIDNRSVKALTARWDGSTWRVHR